MLPDNLNEYAIPDGGGLESGRRLSDYSSTSSDQPVAVYFRNLDQYLIGHIRQARMVLGCFAWLTNKAILEALADVSEGVSIVVQKEDFIRPDTDSSKNWKAELHRRYSALITPPERCAFGGLIGSLSYCGNPTLQAVRCVGNHNRDKKRFFRGCTISF